MVIVENGPANHRTEAREDLGCTLLLHFFELEHGKFSFVLAKLMALRALTRPLRS
jgi:hypothetical protein